MRAEVGLREDDQGAESSPAMSMVSAFKYFSPQSKI